MPDAVDVQGSGSSAEREREQAERYASLRLVGVLGEKAYEMAIACANQASLFDSEREKDWDEAVKAINHARRMR